MAFFGESGEILFVDWVSFVKQIEIVKKLTDLIDDA